jgi:hypothetical protein
MKGAEVDGTPFTFYLAVLSLEKDVTDVCKTETSKTFHSLQMKIICIVRIQDGMHA